jgi:hypothetical protein
MKRAIVAGLFLLANVVGPAWADQCGTAGHTSDMSNTQISTLLAPGTGIYTCYNNGSRRENNETLLSNGHFQEYHFGGATVEDEGTYTINNLSGGGAIRYTYNSGGVYTYRICTDASSAPTYFFINNSSNAVLRIVVSSAPGAC